MRQFLKIFRKIESKIRKTKFEKDEKIKMFEELFKKYRNIC